MIVCNRIRTSLFSILHQVQGDLYLTMLIIHHSIAQPVSKLYNKFCTIVQLGVLWYNI